MDFGPKRERERVGEGYRTCRSRERESESVMKDTELEKLRNRLSTELEKPRNRVSGSYSRPAPRSDLPLQGPRDGGHCLGSLLKCPDEKGGEERRKWEIGGQAGGCVGKKI